ncbi:SGNH/GDSL hydrolase family protein [Microvirga massiliensis]|uniref:SGNH/GDSL hydrolase family protein n=1 Tax=Microvirga massiliensis TaxID=1033741 RepID=UPI00062B6FE3|nr:SGNH/GDSL hydrolase family protein [Microvirga massiliensis]
MPQETRFAGTRWSLALLCGTLAIGLGLVLSYAPLRARSSDEGLASLSPECRAPGSKLYTLATLKRTKAALKAGRTVRVLAFGSSSTAGVGASSALATYPVRLEGELEKLFAGIDFEVTNLGLSGELAAATADRIRARVSQSAPDLVIWQVGTNDALANVSAESFARTLENTLKWLKENRVDTVLVDPQYTSRLGESEVYNDFIDIIDEIAQLNRVPLVRRFEAMQFLAHQQAGAERLYLAGDHFHLNDLGYRCMAEQAARAITLSLLRSG